ncbi:hypothetical protein MRB53_037555 [Persea americana]|nr:hypothetical protein MRB53_037555 [Persea americana]
MGMRSHLTRAARTGKNVTADETMRMTKMEDIRAPEIVSIVMSEVRESHTQVAVVFVAAGVQVALHGSQEVLIADGICEVEVSSHGIGENCGTAAAGVGIRACGIIRAAHLDEGLWSCSTVADEELEKI